MDGRTGIKRDEKIFTKNYKRQEVVESLDRPCTEGTPALRRRLSDTQRKIRGSRFNVMDTYENKMLNRNRLHSSWRTQRRLQAARGN